ncbi:hypothetical protein F5X99DRAFT_396640 [Biscogniauxia marginata]|nr:hypothetical protein F5X99DRAFT_396640 [Biscogniauxia marginata]
MAYNPGNTLSVLIIEYSGSDQIIEALDSTVRTRVVHHSNRSFAFEVTLDLVKGARFFGIKPPLHFYAYQQLPCWADQDLHADS